jgi:hypothetical protein
MHVGRSLTLSIVGHLRWDPGVGTPKMGSPPSPLSINGLAQSCSPLELLCVASLTPPPPPSPLPRWEVEPEEVASWWRSTLGSFSYCSSHAWEKAKRREYGENDVPTPLPLFPDSVVRAIGAATVPLRTPPFSTLAGWDSLRVCLVSGYTPSQHMVAATTMVWHKKLTHDRGNELRNGKPNNI